MKILTLVAQKLYRTATNLMFWTYGVMVPILLFMISTAAFAPDTFSRMARESDFFGDYVWRQDDTPSGSPPTQNMPSDSPPTLATPSMQATSTASPSTQVHSDHIQ